MFTVPSFPKLSILAVLFSPSLAAFTYVIGIAVINVIIANAPAIILFTLFIIFLTSKKITPRMKSTFCLVDFSWRLFIFIKLSFLGLTRLV